VSEDGANRRPDGRFGAGNRANPGGRPKELEEFRKKARSAVDEHVLQAWVDEVQVKPRPRVTLTGTIEVLERGEHWMKASELLAAYGYGKPAQPVEHSGADGEPIGITVNLVKP
jgi:hypothetical protein